MSRPVTIAAVACALALAPGAPAQTLPPARTGLIATRGGIPNTFDPKVTVLTSQSHHVAADRIRDLRILIPNFYAQVAREASSGVAATVECSAQYPIGTFHGCAFGSAAHGTAPAGGYATGIVAPLDIPPRAGFLVRIRMVAPGGIVYSTFPVIGSHADVANGDAMAVGADAAIDQTMGGKIVDSGTGGVLLPAALVGRTRLPSVIITADSIGAGAFDAWSGTSSDLGSVARTIGAYFGYINFGVPGETAAGFGLHDARRRLLFKYATHCVDELGSNDLADSHPAHQVEHDLAVVYDQCAAKGLPVFQTTITPRTSSTDDWATVTGQTPLGAFTQTGAAAAVNGWIRANAHGRLAGHFEVAGAVEPGPGTDVWTADGTAFGPTEDGVHPSAADYLVIKNSGAIDVTLIHR